MKKSEIFLIKLLEKCFKGAREFKQKDLSRELNISIGLINSTVKKLSEIGAVEIKRFSFNIIDLKKILLYSCVKRNISKDIIDSFYVDLPVKKIESLMPAEAVFTAYTAYRLYFNEAPANYGEVYAYIDKKRLSEIRKRFKTENKKPNVFILRLDFSMKNKVLLPLLYIDLWNLKEWYAKEFLNSLERHFKNEGILE